MSSAQARDAGRQDDRAWLADPVLGAAACLDAVPGQDRSRGLNYGANRVRFTGMVPAGSRIRLRLTIKSVEPVKVAAPHHLEGTMEFEGRDRPVLVAETIGVTYD